MLALQPGVASFTRASYDAELHGDAAGAGSALEQALDAVREPAGEAFCRTYLGALAFSAGDLDDGERRSTPRVSTRRPATRRCCWARRACWPRAGTSDRGGARPIERSSTRDRCPSTSSSSASTSSPSAGTDDADEQFALWSTVRALFEASGVRDDLGVALFAADHGDPAEAVAAAQAEFDRRQNIDSHDALAWALHSAGRDAEALRPRPAGDRTRRRQRAVPLPPRGDRGGGRAGPTRRARP